MSTRAATRARKGRTSENSQHDSPTDKENTKVNGVKQENGKSKGKANRGRASKVYCTCRQPDDGTPMILCSQCKEWYHFRCIDLKEEDAEGIHLFVCSSCHEKTGLRTVMEWEGPEAVEEVRDTNNNQGSQEPAMATLTTTKDLRDEEGEEDNVSSDNSEDDDYVAERSKGKRRARRVSMSSESASSDDGTDDHKTTKRLRRGSTATTTSTSAKVKRETASPGPSTQRKRRQSSAVHDQPTKRRKSEAGPTTAAVDAARKYCLSKLQELFTDIFVRYPFLPRDSAAEGGDDQPANEPTKSTEELSAEEKEIVESNAKKFATDLEECLFELYGEHDQNGKQTTGMKYKDRFRMLIFNLSKPDRVLLHKRIASSHITPKELSTMSSTDLANEEQKQSIKQAEQEALAQAILKKTTQPRAKITHKGLEDIEDVNGTATRDREIEEEEEQDRIEKERQARLRMQAERAQAQAAGQGSVPPESPVTPSWGGPPAIPMHALQAQGSPVASPVSSRPPVNPLFVPTASEMVTPAVEGELNLADLINIDEEPSSEQLSISLSIPPTAPQTSAQSPPSNELAAATLQDQSPVQSTPASTTGISPFAAKPELGSRPSFDLSALWNPKEDGASSATQDNLPSQETSSEEDKGPQPVLEEPFGEVANDQDFDMFLQEDEKEKEPTPKPLTPESEKQAFETQPVVWNGKISMPLDSTIPQEVSLYAKQAGGRPLGGVESSLWQTLFPSDHLRIDGRVPVDKSAEYLTQSRLNSSRELIATAFSPASDGYIAFDALIQYLLAKGRHGLVFPWGNRPKEHHPGRELYIVPLLSTEPIPEFLELLDDLKLPKIRDSNLLIGVFVLNKGKLAPPPANQVPAITPAIQPSIPQIPVVPPVPSIPSLSSIPSVPAPPNPLGAPTAMPPSAASLAANVASLTPDQIQAMLRTLASASTIAPVPPAPAMPPGPSMSQHQPWMNPATGFPPSASYPPAVPPPPHHFGGPPPPLPGMSPSRSYPGPPPPGYDQYPNDYPMHPPPHGPGRPGPDYDSFEGRGRGGRGGDRGGFRGRHRGKRDRDKNHGEKSRPRDAGWGGRGRGRGGGSHDKGGRRGGPPPQWG